MTISEDFIRLTPELREIVGGYHVKTTDDGKYCIDILQMLYNWRLVIGPAESNHGWYDHGWCYFGFGERHGVPRDMQTAQLAAYLAAAAWDGTDVPIGYDKQAC